MKKSFLGALLITLVAHNASYAVPSLDALNRCLFNKIANNDSITEILASGAETWLKKASEEEENLSTSKKMAILLGQDPDYPDKNFVKFLKQQIAKQLVEKCGEHIIAAINNDDVKILLCASSLPPEGWETKENNKQQDTENNKQPIYFHPSKYCIQQNADDNRYAIPVTLKSIFEYIPGAFAYIATSGDHALGEQIDTNVTSDNPWDSNCSATAPFWNIPDDAAVNIAGSNVFGSYLPDHEFFFDVYSGDTLAASGILLADEDGSTSEKIVVAKDLKTALDNGDKFAKKIVETGRCRNLKIHLVSLTEIMEDSATRDMSGWATGTAGAGAAAAAATVIWGSAAASSAIPVVGWIAAAGLALAGTGMAAYDSEIIDKDDRHPATVLKTWDLSLPMD